MPVSIRDIHSKNKIKKLTSHYASVPTEHEEDTIANVTPKKSGITMDQAYRNDLKEELANHVADAELGYPVTKANVANKEQEAKNSANYYTGMRQAQGEIDETEKSFNASAKEAQSILDEEDKASWFNKLKK